MNKKVLVGLLGAASLLATGGAQAVLIDSFNNTTHQVQAASGGNDTNTAATAVGETIGANRQMDIPGANPVSGIGNLTMSANPGGSGVLSFSLDALTSGSAIVTWAALGGADLTDAGASTTVTFDILAIDQGLVDLIITVTDTGANVANFTFTNAGVGTQQALFSNFTNFGGTNFASAASVSLEIRGQNASDLVLDQIYTFGQITQVPEPATLGLIGLGLLGFGASRRKAKSVA